MATQQPNEALESAKLVYEQQQYLLDDATEYAKLLRDHRRTATTLLMVALGIGAIKTLTGNPADPLSSLGLTSPISLWLFRISAGALLCGTYWLFTDKSPIPPFWKQSFWNKDKASSAALMALYLEDDVENDLRSKPPVEVYISRTKSTKTALNALKEANKRVRSRINRGVFSFFISLGTALLAIMLYTWSGEERGNDDTTNQSEQRQIDTAGTLPQAVGRPKAEDQGNAGEAEGKASEEPGTPSR